jgi:hypothetical protein
MLIMSPQKTSSMLTKPDMACCGPLIWTAGIESRCLADEQFFHDIGNITTLFLEGDWGSIDEDDWECNIETCKRRTGGTLMGAYKTFDKTRIWVITSGYGQQHMGRDCCYTTILFPEEY